jgi:ABC-type phosphate transport system permease subunit
MANAIVGSMFILGIASLMGVPIGIGAGIYLAEYGRNRFGDAIRFTADVLNGVPSILFGILGLIVFVKFLGWVMKAKKEEVATPPPPTRDQELLTEIRDLLRQKPA